MTIPERAAQIEGHKMNADKVIAQAKSWLGINETENRFIEIINAYNEIPDARKPALVSYPWCAIYVSAVFWKAIGESRFAEMACDRMIQKLQDLGVYSVSGKPSVGDIIFYDWDRNGTSDHVGIVAEVGDGTYSIIEGNKSDSVGYRTIYPNYPYVKGYGFVTRLSEKTEEDPKTDNSPSSSVGQQMSSTVGQQMAEKVVANRAFPTLKLYSKGKWVVVLQALLNARNNAGLDVDGEFGVLTYSAVVKYQAAHGLERDGIVGEKTWGELRK